MCCFACVLKAQDTLQLLDVEITAPREALSHTGKKVDHVDSAVLALYRYNSIADVLSFNSAMHVKSYGPGGLSSTALRGGSAEQTAVLWNGFNLQNTMLGQSDLALMPAMMFDAVEIEYGGSSALWGSGAVGGSIRLSNRSLFNRGEAFSAGAGTGNYGLRNAHADLTFSRKRFISSTKVFHRHAENDFQYVDAGSAHMTVLSQKRAAYSFNNFLQEFRFRLTGKQVLSVHAWLNDNRRQLPPFVQTADSKVTQDDAAARITANWRFISNRFKSEVRAAFISDKVNYTDSLFPIFSKSRTKTWIVENENFFQWARGEQAHVGLSALSTSAQSTFYRSTKGLSRISVIAGNHSRFFGGKAEMALTARAEYFTAGELPVTGTAAFDLHIVRGLSLGTNFARVYRQPTLNELYWTPGGNPDLRPEQGYTSEGVMRYEAGRNQAKIKVSLGAFHRKINDWVLWVPGSGGNPTPLNIRRVWSRGLESNWRLAYTGKRFGAEARFISAYILSTIISTGQQNDNSVDKQLVYTPRYTYNANLIVYRDRTSLALFHQYVGYRFTSTDNEEWLVPYQVTSARLSQQMSMRNAGVRLFASCNNIFNVNYQVLDNRPMPLRNYEFGLSLELTNNKQRIPANDQ